MADNKQMAFYFDQTRCTGCQTCVIACKDWHDIQETGVNWLRILTIEEGKFPHLFLAHLFVPCFHCENPPCVAACPARAIEKRKADGVVAVDDAKCVGRKACGSHCLNACPWGAPQFGNSPDSKMQKCDLCMEKLERGEKPACVAACPMYALDTGTLEELREKYGSAAYAKGFKCLEGFRPSVILKAKPSSVG